jgi:O-antigen/teichoic acid export membrane protein
MLTFGSMLLFTAATTATALVTTPLLVRWLGEERFGAYRAVNDWYGYLTLLDFGVGGAMAPLLARALGRGDRRALRGALAAGVRAYLGITALALVVGAAMTPLITWQVVVPPGLVGELRLAWLLSLLSFLPMGLAPLRTLAEADQRGYRVNLLMTVQCLLITALSLLLARAGWGIAGQALAFSAGIMTFFVLLAWDGLRAGPAPPPSALLERPDPEVWRAIWALSLPSLLINLSGRVSLLTDNIVVVGILGAAAVASLVVTQRLATLTMAVLQAIGGASWAALADLHARGDRDAFNRRLVELTNLVAVLGIAALGPIVAYNRDFVRLWMGPGFPYGGDRVVAVAAFNALIGAVLSLWGWCFTGTGHVRQVTVPLIVSAAINLAASVALTRRLGLVGPILGTTTAYLLVNGWCFPLLLRRVFGVAPGALARALAVPAAWGVPYVAGLWALTRAHRPWGWAGLAAEMSAAALGFLALGAVAILSPTDRDLWRRRLEALWRRDDGPSDH